MATIFVISDTHFGHANTFLKFRTGTCTCYPWEGHHTTDCASKPMRPFTSVEEMDETMIARWNSVVQPHDKIYHLGDVIVRSDHHQLLARLNGHKRLVLGNHDKLDMSTYLKYFEAIYSSRSFDGWLMTHIPVHPQSIGGRTKANIHGHVHNNQHRLPNELPCPPYINVCVEVINYTPIALDALRSRL